MFGQVVLRAKRLIMDHGGDTMLTDTMDIRRYKVSIRLRHPTMDPDEISLCLNIEPSITWRSGDQRRTREGEILEGLYDHTYWVGTLTGDRTSQSLIDTLEHYLRNLETRADFMRRFNETGGSAEFFIGWFGSGGATFAWNLLERCAYLRIELGMDVYEND